MTNVPPASSALQQRLLPHLAQLKARAANLNRSPSDAEDLLQDTLERALRKASYFQAQPVPGRWLLRVMYNCFADDWRRRSRVRTLATLEEDRLASPAPYQPSPWEMLTEADVAKAMLQLPPVLQAIVRMSVLEKRSYREIGNAFGIPVATVGTRLYRARLQMKRILSSATPFPGDRVGKKAARQAERPPAVAAGSRLESVG